MKTNREIAWKDCSFMGYHRSDGSVGTANYWLVVPLVFCENRNVKVIKKALINTLGYAKPEKYQGFIKQLASLHRTGAGIKAIPESKFEETVTDTIETAPFFKNVDGIKFLTHDGGCGGTRQDAQALCALLAGYITHPNVAGATVLSLGCQNAQVSMLEEEIRKRSPQFDKPLYILEQQKTGTETNLVTSAIKQTFEGLAIANKIERKPAPVSKLCIGLETGRPDGVLSNAVNPAPVYTAELLMDAGGTAILSEFPEAGDGEQAMSNRRVRVLDYSEKLTGSGLNLLRRPGTDVESITAEVASGANIILFTTGSGTPIGNPIAPVVKLSDNTELYNRLPGVIDINAGTVTEGEETIEEAGERILEYVLKVASGEIRVNAVKNEQDDFIPWKRGVSL